MAAIISMTNLNFQRVFLMPTKSSQQSIKEHELKIIVIKTQFMQILLEALYGNQAEYIYHLHLHRSSNLLGNCILRNSKTDV